MIKETNTICNCSQGLGWTEIKYCNDCQKPIHKQWPREIEIKPIKLAELSDKQLDDMWFFMVGKMITRFDIPSQDIPIKAGDFVKYLRQLEKSDPDNYRRLEEVVSLYLSYNSEL